MKFHSNMLFSFSGAETIVELFLNVPNTVSDEESVKPSTSSSQSSSSQTFSSKSQPSSSKSSPCKLSKAYSCETHLSPLPSTSAQAHDTYQTPTEMVIKQEPLLNPEIIVKQESTIKQEPMEISASEGIWQNGLPPQLTSLNIKTEPVQSVIVPQLKICDQNNVNVSNIKNRVTLPIPNTTLTTLKGTAKKTFVKCVGKDGKVSLMELIRDEKNPKLFKIVLPPGVQSNKMVLSGTNQISAPVVISSNFIRPMAPKLNVTIGASTVNSVSSGNFSGASVSPSTLMCPKLVSSVKIPLVQSPTSTQLGVSRQISIENVTSPSKNQLLTMPKLVAINSPHPSTSRPIPSPKIVVPQSRITTVPSTPISNTMHKINLSPITTIMQNNNKILLLDSSRLPKSQGQSLLKPQVSLLKPRITSTKTNQLKKITVSNISGMENRNINIFVPADVRIDSNVQKSQANNQVCHKYDEEFEQRFLARKSFSSMTEAIGWLLKEIPLISKLAIQSEFRESFPFVVPSSGVFHSLLIAKQRSFEVRNLFFFS